MAKIMIEIECNKKSCGQCPMVTGLMSTKFCAIFRYPLNIDKPIRLPECIAAEVKE